MKILIVDDSKVMQQIAHGILSANLDAEFEFAGNGHEGIEVAQKFEPDLVLTDLNMPEMGGVEMATQLRELGVNAKIGAITAERSSEKIEAMQQAGISFSISKPIDETELLKSIKQAFASEQETPENLSSDEQLFADMNKGVVLPASDKIESLLNSFFRQPVSFQRVSELTKISTGPFVVATYSSKNKPNKFIVILSVSCCVHLVGSMTELAESTIEVVQQLGKIRDDILLETKEILSISARIFETTEDVFSLDQVYVVDKPAEHFKKMLSNIGLHRVDLEMQSKVGIGKSRLSIIAANK